MAATTLEHKETESKPGKHDRHCFIVMPFGRGSSEQKWFRGWYEVVIKPTVQAAGYEPKLAAAEEQPGAINDEIRTHLAFDQMVVVDLGGTAPEEEPNPNVMQRCPPRIKDRPITWASVRSDTAQERLA